MATDVAQHRSGPPLWLVEGLDLARVRGRTLLATAGIVVFAGLVLAWALPSLVPPSPIVGVGVGLAGLLLGAALVVTLDSTDLTVRGPRHVGAAGGSLAALLPVEPDPVAAGPLARSLLQAFDGTRFVGIASASSDASRTSAWCQALAQAFTAEECGVLVVDLASGRSDTPGLAEVAAGTATLAQAAEVDSGVKLARLSAGDDVSAAFAGLDSLRARAPRDLDVVVVALPYAASRRVASAIPHFDVALVLAERDRTSRVDLVAGVQVVGNRARLTPVILLDDRLAPDRDALPPDLDPEPADAAGPVLAAAPARESVAERAPEVERAPEPATPAVPVTEREPVVERAPQAATPAPVTTEREPVTERAPKAAAPAVPVTEREPVVERAPQAATPVAPATERERVTRRASEVERAPEAATSAPVTESTPAATPAVTPAVEPTRPAVPVVPATPPVSTPVAQPTPAATPVGPSSSAAATHGIDVARRDVSPTGVSEPVREAPVSPASGASVPEAPTPAAAPEPWAAGDERDLLRTTAQLAMIGDAFAAHEDPEPPSTSSRPERTEPDDHARF